ncbi:hypothetical protein C4579_02630 [Candidatus Microgenomates bacterium]|nr:MAG: hypothetical protein C4579_02630 [Candidatus Microgenomates bacterium]
MHEDRTHITELSQQFEQRKPFLSHQLNEMFAIQKALFGDRFGGLSHEKERQFAWAKAFVQKFILVRADRANDINKSELYQARELAAALFGSENHHFVLGCMDGRNIPAVVMSHPAHVGGTARTQGGEFFGISDGIGADVRIQPDSYLVGRVQALLRNKRGEKIFYSLDSHKGCAARGLASKVKGMVYDGGLRDDILRKIQIARGLNKIRQDLDQQEVVAEIYPQFFSFDPHDGSMTMGLEMHLDTDTVGKKGFTPEVLEQLSKEGKIVTTWDFLFDPQVQSILEQQVQPVDFRNQYAESMLSNWTAITNLYAGGNGEVFQRIYDSLYQAYQNSGWQVGEAEDLENKVISENGLIHKAKIMLKNIVTRWSIAQDHHVWPFDVHNEQAIVLTEGGYGPFTEISVFSIFSKEDNDLLMDDTRLALGLVRDFRRRGAETQGAEGISDPLGMLEGDEFIEAPILIMNKAIMRNIPDEAWEHLQNIDLTSLLTSIDWDDFKLREWTRADVEKHLRDGNGNLASTHYDIAVSYIDGVYELFDRMRHMMLVDNQFREMLIHGNIMVMNLMVDADRRARILLPLTV